MSGFPDISFFHNDSNVFNGDTALASSLLVAIAVELSSGNCKKEAINYLEYKHLLFNSAKGYIIIDDIFP